MRTLTVEQAYQDWQGAIAQDAPLAVHVALGRDYAAARDATETLDQRAFRLGLRAADKDAEAGRHLAAAADAAGMAAGRRLRWGQDDPTAASLQREADHCTALAEEADAEAYRLRSQAAALRRADIAQRKVA
jgi:hypothetical protein